MYKVVAHIKRKPGTSREAFRRYYETQHALLVRRLLGHHMIRYTRSYPVDGFQNDTDAFHHPDGGAEVSSAPFDVMTEVWVDDAEAIKRLYQASCEPEAAEEIRADEVQFMDQTTLVAYICEEVISDLTTVTN